MVHDLWSIHNALASLEVVLQYKTLLEEMGANLRGRDRADQGRTELNSGRYEQDGQTGQVKIRQNRLVGVAPQDKR